MMQKPQPSIRLALVTLAMLGLYAFSFGPACWLMHSCKGGYRQVEMFYRPILWLGVKGPKPVTHLIARCANFGATNNDWYVYPDDLTLMRVGICGGIGGF